MIKITEKAKRVIPETLKNHPSKMLRIIISGFGWGGPRIGLVLDEPNKEEIHTFDKVKILIESRIENYLGSLIIDVVKNFRNEDELIVRSNYGAC